MREISSVATVERKLKSKKRGIDVKEKLKKIGIVLLYEVILVPLLGIVTYSLYNHFVVEAPWGASQGVMTVTMLLFIALNIGCLYFLATLYVKKLQYPFVYHMIGGLIPIFVSVWGYVYFKTIEKAACDGASLLNCSDAVLDLKNVKLALIAFIAYYFLFVVLLKMIKKQK